MPEGQVLEFVRVSKHFGGVQAVSELTARVEPGAVTGFLGPNGAGKTTSLRMLLGLVRPTAGTATIGGLPYERLEHPLQTVGAVLEASSFHPGRSAANHLKAYAQAAALPVARVDEVLALVGLSDAAGRRVGGFSLGMRQRLGLAAALLGDPGVLVLDEPVNGLDPEGITWMRQLLRALAAEGRTVLMSSHLLAEVAQTVDRLLIIAAGRLVFEGAIEDLADRTEYATVVDAPNRGALETTLQREGIAFDVLRGGLTARGQEPERIGALAAAHGIALSTLQRRGPSLEDVFFQLVDGSRVQGAPAPGTPGTPGAAPAPGGAALPDDPTDAPPSPVSEAESRTRDERSDVAIRDTADPASPARRSAAPRPDERRTPPPLIDHGGHAAFAVATTGVVDIVRPSTEADGEVVAGEPDALPGADQTDAGRSADQTDADREADAFFRSFDGGGTADAVSAPPTPAVDADAASSADTETDATPPTSRPDERDRP